MSPIPKAKKKTYKPNARSIIIAEERANKTLKWERLLEYQLKCLGLKDVYLGVSQFKFHPTRQWAYDRGWPELMFVIDIDGGEWMKRSGHNTGNGMRRDREKDCEALLAGYKIMRFTGDMVDEGVAAAYIEKLFKGFKT